MNIGAHLSCAGGYTSAIKKLKEIGGTSLQFFSYSPLQWKKKEINPEEIVQFKKEITENSVKDIYFHAPYLINLAYVDAIGETSVSFLTHELRLAAQLGIKGSVVHTGSFKQGEKKYKDTCTNIEKILNNTPEETLLILENAGNRKIGATLEELGILIQQIRNPRLKICLDTCHLHAAGYDLSTKISLDTLSSTIETSFGWDSVEVIHLNDSKDPLGSFRDRHENLGKGEIGEEGLKNILTHPSYKSLPFILEVPGFARKGPDQDNIEKAYYLSKEFRSFEQEV